jgi:demethylmenaquinone methyltransferase/2-methoxy-6-polyprenyl-1,4-benzoquinol methylase
MLPFPSDSLDAVVSGFLSRNLSDLYQGLTEQYRVLKPGGKIAVLDTTRRQKNILTPLIRFYMYRLIPAFSKLITGNKEDYLYLYESTESFLRAEELAAYLSAVGFKKVLFKRLMFGMIAVHRGEK